MGAGPEQTWLQWLDEPAFVVATVARASFHRRERKRLLFASRRVQPASAAIALPPRARPPAWLIRTNPNRAVMARHESQPAPPEPDHHRRFRSFPTPIEVHLPASVSAEDALRFALVAVWSWVREMLVDNPELIAEWLTAGLAIGVNSTATDADLQALAEGAKHIARDQDGDVRGVVRTANR